MRSKKVINLIDYKIESNSYSDEGTKTPVITQVYANTYSLSSSQQLQAQHEGLRLSGRVEIWTFEYDGQVDLQLEGSTDTHTILSVEERGDKTYLNYGERLSKW